MAESTIDILKEMKKSFPKCLGVAVYSINDGLAIAEDIDFPDYDPSYTSAMHISIWKEITKLVNLLPDGLDGNINNILLELKSTYFLSQIARNKKFIILAAIKNMENIGILKVVTKKYLPRLNNSFENKKNR